MFMFLKTILLILKILQEIKAVLERWDFQKMFEVPDAEIWLDAADVKRLLNISDMTLYRRRLEGRLIAKKIGGKWYYLKSSL